MPGEKYDEFLAQASDPDEANYWDVVVEQPKTQPVKMEAEDNAFSLYEMENGAIGVFHIARADAPHASRVHRQGGLRIFGTDGNLALGTGGNFASIISEHRDKLPNVDDDGWYHVEPRGLSPGQPWPRPGAFNYYEQSTQHLVDCIIHDRDPILNVEWGRHINELLVGRARIVAHGQAV